MARDKARLVAKLHKLIAEIVYSDGGGESLHGLIGIRIILRNYLTAIEAF